MEKRKGEPGKISQEVSHGNLSTQHRLQAFTYNSLNFRPNKKKELIRD
ncbi:hypothetical protein ACFOG5_24050 [Pedobacter fastidiosus]